MRFYSRILLLYNNHAHITTQISCSVKKLNQNAISRAISPWRGTYRTKSPLCTWGQVVEKAGATAYAEKEPEFVEVAPGYCVACNVNSGWGVFYSGLHHHMRK
jgi:hypothetical protein